MNSSSGKHFLPSDSPAAGDACRRGKVLFLAAQPFFRWRGSPIRVAYDVAALAESGYAVDLLTLPIGDQIAIPGVTIQRVANPLKIRDVPIGPSPAKVFFDFLIAIRGRRLVRENRYAFVHGVEECGLIAWWLARRCGARAVYEKHSDPVSHRSNPVRNLILRLYAAVERFMVRRSDLVIATGPGLVQQALRMGCRAPCHHIPDIPSSRVEADPEAVALERSRSSPDPDSIQVAYVGSFAGYQGIDLLFGAIPPAVRQCPRLRFIVVGGNREQIAARREQMAGAGCAAAVVFKGQVPPDNLPAMLAAADILLSPRISGTNTPLKLLDYLKAGRAVVATDLPANRQILDEANAVFVKPEPEALAAGIVALANDQERRKRLGQAGRAMIRKHYNYEVFKHGLARAYGSLT